VLETAQQLRAVAEADLRAAAARASSAEQAAALAQRRASKLEAELAESLATKERLSGRLAMPTSSQACQWNTVVRSPRRCRSCPSILASMSLASE
jgi:hypothetical protein